MYQQEFLYSLDSRLIALSLFLGILAFNEVGFRIGRFVQTNTDEELKALTGTVQASILGLLALLLGFTFSMAMQRFDNRSMALIDEANALGTAVLRVELLPEQHQAQLKQLFADYINLRAELGGVDLTQVDERLAYAKKIDVVQAQMWQLAIQATNDDPRPVTTGAFTSALNEAIDMRGKRNALLQMHVPESVLLLLFIVFVSSGAMLGYSGGLSNKRIIVPASLIAFLITLIVFLIIDLDRPKRGVIQVDQSAMHDLQRSLNTPDQP